MTKSLFQNIVFALIIYLLLLFKLGYEFGGGDQVEVLPFALFLKDATLFSNDIYIQSAAAVFPNERWFIIQLVNLVPQQFMYVWCLILHLLFSLLLISGLRNIASLYIENEWLQWLAVIINLVVLYLYAPGGNELYYNTLSASLVAKAIGAWAVFYFFNNRFFLSVLLLIPVTWFHPLVGIHLAILFFGTFVINNLKEYKKHLFTFYKTLFTYLLLAVSFVLYIKLKTDAMQVNSSLSDHDFYNILFDFRNPHHYNPLAFSRKAFLFTSILLLIAFYSFRKNKIVLWFLVTGIGLFMLGTLNALSIKNINIASLQFFKIAIWLKFFGVIGTTILVSKLFTLVPPTVFKKYQLFLSATMLMLLAVIYFTSNNFELNFSKPEAYSSNAEANISQKAKVISDKNAVFIHPLSFTKFLFYAERSTYVNFKAIAREKNYIETWIKRLSLVYNIDANMPEKGFDIQAKANANFSNIDFAETQLLKEKGITHMITFKTHEIENLEVLAENEQYRIYKL